MMSDQMVKDQIMDDQRTSDQPMEAQMVNDHGTNRRMADARELQIIARLFSYPDRPPEAEDLEKLDGTWDLGSKERGLEALQAEYVRLFINALPEVPCPPYGSYYLEGSLMGESTVEVGRLYSSYGFETNEMADHIAVELEFLALLTALPPEAPVGEDRDFLLGHLNLWMPEFLDRIEKNDQLGFYRDVAGHAKAVFSVMS